MGLFEKLFGRKSQQVAQAAGKSESFQTLTAYRPAFTSWNGKMYEDALIRAVVDAIARHISKLRIELVGSAKPELKAAIKQGANSMQSTSQMLYRAATILFLCNNLPIVPELDEFGRTVGYFPVLPTMCELVQYDGNVYLRYSFSNGQKAAIEGTRCTILTRHQFRDDVFGEDNKALNTTLALLDLQKQGVEEGIRNSATFRFMARLGNFAKPEDLAKERQRFNKENLQGEGNGILLFPNTYTDIQQITSKPYNIDPEELKTIQKNIFDYFGCNEKVVQNTAIGDDLDAFFDGCIEPFAIQLSEGLTRMTYTPHEIAMGNKVLITANRLQYMSTGNKIALAQQLGDRGVLMIDEIRELFNYAPLPDGTGQHAPIRGEYYFADQGKEGNNGQD
jgi:hypothetical protein